MQELERVFAAFMEEQGLRRGGQDILAAVSGGPDSMALMHLCQQWDPEHIHVFHLNHGLRPEAAADAQFVADTAAQWGLPVHSYTYDVTAAAKERGESKQLAARRIRLQLLEQCAAQYHCDYAATAHHADDQAETMVMRILRGTGLTGLKGIEPRRGLLLRPLLAVSKKELLQYCASHGIPYRRDASNQSDDYFRNRIRHHVMPVLAAATDDLNRRLAVLGSLTTADDDYLELQAAQLWETIARDDGLDRWELRQLHPSMQRRLLRRLLFTFQGHGRRIGFEHIEAIREHLAKPGSFCVHIPSMVVRGGANTIRVESHAVDADAGHDEDWSPVQFTPPAQISGPFGTITAEMLSRAAMEAERDRQEEQALVEYFDAEGLQLPLMVRRRRCGDRMVTFGGPQKRLHRLFIDGKIPQEQRGRLPIICDAREILWVPGVRRAETGRITTETEDVIRLSYSAG